MPKRVLDFDAMWGSDKLASCAEWAQAEYAWLYGLADASGCFELTNLRVIWGRVAAIRRNLTLERLEQIFNEFQDKGLLFAWEENGKRYGHWTGSDVPGRLPPPSWRMRLERLAPPVPKQLFAEYMSRFSRGRATSPGGGFHADNSQGATQGSLKPPLDRGLQGGLEEAQAQDWKWNKKESKEVKQHTSDKRGAEREPSQQPEQDQPVLPNLNSNPSIPQPEQQGAAPHPAFRSLPARAAAADAAPAAPIRYVRDKSSFVARELAVGQGPSCGPVRVKPQVLDRIRARDGSRSP
ncbi:MAG: hypothetical protein LAN18_01025 [Acidobacteriia bacterium]|nr:hypothetical protein [Terriglobia bacterium]